MNDLVVFAAWWLAMALVGALAFPTCFFTFRHLPDRGYALSRTLGLLVASYFAWLAAHVTTGGVPILIGLAALAGVSAFFGRGLWRSQLQFLKANVGYVLLVEVIFFLLLWVGIAYEISTGAIFQTEKPADFSVLNGILQTPHMPPRDPWAAGAYVSYYYFGFYMLAFLAKLTGTVPAVAYNMGLALTMASTGVVALGLGYALTGKRRWGLLLVFAMTFMGNLDYWFRVAHVYEFGDLQTRYLANHPADPLLHKGLQGVFEYLMQPISHHWEYFQASRIADLTPGEHLISEFPAFSFVLADVHPHLIALPFVMLTLCLSLSIARAPRPGWLAFGPTWGLRIGQGLLAAVVYGSLGFINSWDLPTVLAVLGAALVLRELWAGADGWRWIVRVLGVLAPITVLAVVAFAPFYHTLRTQARGIGVVLKDAATPSGPVPARTDLYFWLVLVGPFLLVLVPALIARARGPMLHPPEPARPPRPMDEPAKAPRPKRKRAPAPARKAAPSAAPPRLARACSLCGQAAAADTDECAACGGDVVSTTPRAVLPDHWGRRWLSATGRFLAGGVRPWGYALLAVVTAVAIFDLAYPLWNPAVTVFSLLLLVLALAGIAARGESRELSFAAALTAIAFLLMAGGEWFYVRDEFVAYAHLPRMNTMFKFYVQVWVLLSAASVAFLAWFWDEVWPSWGVVARRTWAALAVFVGIGVVAFPIAAYYDRVTHYGASFSQLDGTEFLSVVAPEDWRALNWLRGQVSPYGYHPPVILEAWGGSFTLSARVATYLGLPTVLGWEGHEQQWRGGRARAIWQGVDEADTVEQRYQDIDQLYTSPDLAFTRAAIRRYAIELVYVGKFEREKYPAADFSKWEKLGRAIYADGPVVIYALDKP
jgi:uncharacterized membrane protein